jgi:hypothetical protein
MRRLTRARAAGLELCELDLWYDVDEPASLHRLISDMARGGGDAVYPAPHTADCITRLGLGVLAGSRDKTHYAAMPQAVATGASQ